MYKRQIHDGTTKLHEQLAALQIRDLVAAAPVDLSGVYTPVSYTHLRAHETVLDLVCRLLLEKKKCKESDTAMISRPSSFI